MVYIYKKFISPGMLYTENRVYLVNMLKMSFLAIFFLFGIILLIEKNYSELFYSQLLIFPLFFLVSPAIGGLIGGGFIMDYVKNRKLRWNYIIPFTVVLIAYLVYVITGISGFPNYSESSISGILSSIPWHKLRLLVTIPLLYIVLFFHLFLTVILLCNTKTIIKHIKRFLIPIVCFYLCVIVASVIARGFNRDASQIISVTYQAILAVLFPSIILYYWDHIKLYNNARKYATYSMVLISVLIGLYTINQLMSRKLYPVKESRRVYEKKVVDLISPEKLLKIGVISNYPQSDFINNVVVAFGTFQTYLDAYYDNVMYYQLNIQREYSIPYETLYSIGLKETVMKEDDYRIKFINDNQINYIIVRPDTSLPANLCDYYELMAQDETGESFYKRKIYK
jgi:hypothetical protein